MPKLILILLFIASTTSTTAKDFDFSDDLFLELGIDSLELYFDEKIGIDSPLTKFKIETIDSWKYDAGIALGGFLSKFVLEKDKGSQAEGRYLYFNFDHQSFRCNTILSKVFIKKSKKVVEQSFKIFKCAKSIDGKVSGEKRYHSLSANIKDNDSELKMRDSEKEIDIEVDPILAYVLKEMVQPNSD
jgi:hypothetical protein